MGIQPDFYRAHRNKMIFSRIDNPDSIYPDRPRSTKRLRVLIYLCYLFVANIVLASQVGASQADEKSMVSGYEAAMAQGDPVAAIRHLLEYSEQTNVKMTR